LLILGKSGISGFCSKRALTFAAYSFDYRRKSCDTSTLFPEAPFGVEVANLVTEAAMASAEVHRGISEPVNIGDSVDIGLEADSNRRLHERLKASDLHWLRAARLKYGAAIRVLDISAGGMLLETENALAPDTNVVVELTGPESPILIPSRVLRCRAASLGDVLTYHGACAFKRPLAIPELAAKLAVQTPQPTMSTPVAAAPSVGWQKVVARFNDGRIVCGYTNDFHPSKTQLHLSPNPRHGESTLIPLSQLKALFFVREFAGNPTLVETKVFSEAPKGRKMEVTFHDNEVIIGSTLSYRGVGNGFFLQPADPRSNNLRVFVTAAGLQQARFL
jgi:Family of unknown function (DUF6982)/PilZ domain